MDPEMEKTPATTPTAESAPAVYLGDLDRETFDLLIEDKIATGG